MEHETLGGVLMMIRARFSRAALSVLALASVTLTGLVVSLGAASSPASAATGTTVSRGVSTIAPDVYEARVQRAINRERTSRGLRALRFQSCTDGFAERWSRHLATTSRFEHQSMGRILSTCGATYAGETLVKGPVGPRQAVKLWLQSPGHRAVLLSKSPSRFGVGARLDANGVWVVAANFTRF